MSTTFAANNDLDTELDTSGFDAGDALPSAGGKACDKPGMYHVFVKDIKAEGNQDPDKGKLATPCRRIDLEIVAGSNPDQVGRTIFHRVYIKKAVRSKNASTGKDEVTGFEDLADGARQQMLRTAFGLSLLSEDDIGKGTVRIPWSLAPGRQCVVRVDEEEEDDFKVPGKKRVVHRISFGNFYRVDHPDVKDVPKDAESLAMLASGGANVDLSDI